MTDPLVLRPRADAQPQRPRPQVLVLACRRVCWALPGRHRAGGRTRRSCAEDDKVGADHMG
eukprot:scaffold95464_cov62-Phaeocystis_antarctica.AAC.1